MLSGLTVDLQPVMARMTAMTVRATFVQEDEFMPTLYIVALPPAYSRAEVGPAPDRQARPPPTMPLRRRLFFISTTFLPAAFFAAFARLP